MRISTSFIPRRSTERALFARTTTAARRAGIIAAKLRNPQAPAAREPGKRGTRAYFDVDDINAGAERVRELGGEADEPQPVPGMGWFATCRDPHGNDFGLWQTDPSASPPA